MIFGIDENCVVRASSHARFAADTNRFVEIDDAVSAFEHGRGGTGDDTGCVRALITAGDLMRAFVEEFRQRLFLRPANVHGFATYDLRDVRRLIVHVADQDRLRRTDNDAGGLEPDVDAMRAEITFLG